ncbi:translation initiation factor 2B subunit I family (IF-2BI) [Ignisphaera aggregans DSM 17230]|uniref:Putative methylthioribose-1-phosphate isomerase n=1 Tax=Ignisphaera aggregans (strain DSM 17230 / JCM 13409 / AQ1.S1) TaxID=583356 RepID=E0SPG9_IGNAA|nr:translation initiation factor 2B subunit I family (IF-2BI) [Ignisphaera aggregans DSM 17230]
MSKYPLIVRAVEWVDGKVRWINTNLLPYEELYEESQDHERIARAIESMEIRGAPAIGVAAALAIAATALKFSNINSVDELKDIISKAIERLRRTRPTAFNLFWALNRISNVLSRNYSSVEALRKAIVDEALSIYHEDIETNIKIGEIGEKLIDDGDTILTHCNAGALATAAFGTALGVIRAAWYNGKKIKVIATETRPVLQGARLTVWELKKEGIPVTLVTDNMVGYIMYKGLVNKVIVGADRILLDGFVINKIGTYSIAIIAKRHGVPFYVAAPTSTIDPVSSINDIVIEERNANEVRYIMNKMLITMPDVDVLNPAFDVTPPELVTSIITEKGIIEPPFRENIMKILSL